LSVSTSALDIACSSGEIAGARDVRERNICLILLINMLFLCITIPDTCRVLL